MTPEEIAKGLTEAQKRALLKAEIDGHLGYRFVRWWQATGATLRAIRRKGLATAVWSGVMLNDTGLAVRAILEGE